MNRLALPPTGMLSGHHVLIGTSMGMGCLWRNNAVAPLRTTFVALRCHSNLIGSSANPRNT